LPKIESQFEAYLLLVPTRVIVTKSPYSKNRDRRSLERRGRNHQSSVWIWYRSRQLGGANDASQQGFRSIQPDSLVR
jgi:hypothetical protein